MMDWSRFRSHSSFIQSFILSNTIEWQLLNAPEPNWMDIRERRFLHSNDSYKRNELYPMWISFNWSQFIITHLFPSLGPLSSLKLSFPMMIVSNSFNPSITNRFTFSKQSSPITIRFNDINELFSINDDISGLKRSSINRDSICQIYLV